MITAVSACPRPSPGESYLSQTVASLLNAGATDVYYLDDVCRIGSGLAVIQLIRELHERFPGEDVLLLEDDVIACRNAIPAAERLSFPANYHVLNLYLDMSAALPFKGYHIRMVPARDGFVYAQAVKIRSDMIRHIATTPFQPESDSPFWLFREATLWHYFRQGGGFIGYVEASWFEHIGDVSAITEQVRTYKPRAKNWRGVDHDALTDDVSTLLYV